MYWTVFLRSASLPLKAACLVSLPSTFIMPPFSSPSMVAAPSALPLYFAATLLYDGPSLSAETEWHFRQPPDLSDASAFAASCACANGIQARPATTATSAICFMCFSLDPGQIPGSWDYKGTTAPGLLAFGPIGAPSESPQSAPMRSVSLVVPPPGSALAWWLALRPWPFTISPAPLLAGPAL